LIILGLKKKQNKVETSTKLVKAIQDIKKLLKRYNFKKVSLGWDSEDIDLISISKNFYFLTVPYSYSLTIFKDCGIEIKPVLSLC